MLGNERYIKHTSKLMDALLCALCVFSVHSVSLYFLGSLKTLVPQIFTYTQKIRSRKYRDLLSEIVFICISKLSALFLFPNLKYSNI